MLLPQFGAKGRRSIGASCLCNIVAIKAAVLQMRVEMGAR